jgi:hypothetical protein
MTKKSTLKIEFENPEALHHFAVWLCESGEQKYWDWMEIRESEEDGPITAVDFEYFPILDASKPETDDARYGYFVGDDTVRTTCGRLDR